MSDTEKTEDEVVMVEVDDEGKELKPKSEKPAKEDVPEAEEPDSDDDEDDERLAESQDDTDDEVTSQSKAERNRQNRAKRKQAEQRRKAELAMLREQVALLQSEVRNVRGDTIATSAKTIEGELAAAQEAVRQAEFIIAQAIKEGNGDDVLLAMRHRDDAKERVSELTRAKEQTQQRHAEILKPQGPDPAVQTHAQQWMRANPWYNTDAEATRITNTVDAEMVREGYNPATQEYWRELSRRVQDELNEAAVQDKPNTRKSPPTRSAREHVPSSTRKEVYVTPERKQAMIEAGYWDDPVKRNQMLKAYRDHDLKNSAR
ncbi:hypothetical protein [Caulobacter phage KcrB]|nr:hypothetical protein RW_GP089c [Caulobacter phage RW]WCA46393.1 hypothetical protein [Caulobacter phage KcrB]WCD56328.1 hypothetical protein [Caulobacter phage RLK]WNV48120.1 hypothetical protein GB2A_gp088c [Caulobacter phage GB2A]